MSLDHIGTVLGRFDPSCAKLQVADDTLVVAPRDWWFIRFWKWLTGIQVREDARVCKVALKIFSENIYNINWVPNAAFTKLQNAYFYQFPDKLEILQRIQEISHRLVPFKQIEKHYRNLPEALMPLKHFEQFCQNNHVDVIYNTVNNLSVTVTDFLDACGQIEVQVGEDQTFVVSRARLNGCGFLQPMLENLEEVEDGNVPKLAVPFKEDSEALTGAEMHQSIAAWKLYFTCCNQPEKVEQLTNKQLLVAIEQAEFLGDSQWNEDLCSQAMLQLTRADLLQVLRDQAYAPRSLFIQRIAELLAGELNVNGDCNLQDELQDIPCVYLAEMGKFAVSYLAHNYRLKADATHIAVMLLTASIDTLAAIAKAIPVEYVPSFLNMLEAHARCQVQVNMPDQEKHHYLSDEYKKIVWGDHQEDRQINCSLDRTNDGLSTATKYLRQPPDTDLEIDELLQILRSGLDQLEHHWKRLSSLDPKYWLVLMRSEYEQLRFFLYLLKCEADNGDCSVEPRSGVWEEADRNFDALFNVIQRLLVDGVSFLAQLRRLRRDPNGAPETACPPPPSCVQDLLHSPRKAIYGMLYYNYSLLYFSIGNLNNGKKSLRMSLQLGLITDENKDTIFIDAVKNGQKNLVKIFLICGADPRLVNKETGQNAWDVAGDEMKQLLQEYPKSREFADYQEKLLMSRIQERL